MRNQQQQKKKKTSAIIFKEVIVWVRFVATPRSVSARIFCSNKMHSHDFGNAISMIACEVKRSYGRRASSVGMK